jgi:hypothetical protein
VRVDGKGKRVRTSSGRAYFPCGLSHSVYYSLLALLLPLLSYSH